MPVVTAPAQQAAQRGKPVSAPAWRGHEQSRPAHGPNKKTILVSYPLLLFSIGNRAAAGRQPAGQLPAGWGLAKAVDRPKT
jgi:hypothetical protein